MRLNIQPISKVNGILIVIYGGLMLLVGIYAMLINSGDGTSIFSAGALTSFIGIVLWKLKVGKSNTINKREGYLIVLLSWFFMAIFGSLPYLFHGCLGNIPNAIFESTSGLTTTGASVFNDIEALPKGILLWRSLTQWIGGMGIIVLTVALMPLLGIAGIELFVAEAPGPTADKIHPRIKETAKRLWFIYVGLTLVLSIILFLEGMTPFDALNHSFTTMATGGFSTKNASLAHYSNPAIHYTIGFFMILAGTNYFVIYKLLKGNFRIAWNNEEFRWYLFVISLMTLVIFIGIIFTQTLPIEATFRTSFFMVVSMITTTGFVIADYTIWSDGITSLFFLMLFIGGCAGSTAGGIKLIRHMVFAKNSFLEFKRILHPRALIRIKINKELVAPRILTHILVFLLVYLLTFVLGTILISFTGMDLISAAGAAATSLGNVGPAIGNVGPVDNFSDVSETGKLILSFLMILGRLELFTVLVIFTPYFWKTH